MLVRLAAVWAPTEQLTVTPSFYYQDRYRNDVENYWPLYSNPDSNRFVNANPTQRSAPDRFYLPALKIEGGFRRHEADFEHLVLSSARMKPATTARCTTWASTRHSWAPDYSLLNPLLLDNNGVHLPPGATELPVARLGRQRPAEHHPGNPPAVERSGGPVHLDRRACSSATTGRRYLEQIHDPMLNQFTAGDDGCALHGSLHRRRRQSRALMIQRYPQDSYFLLTNAKDQQLAVFGEGTYGFTDQFKLTVGARYSHSKYSFTSMTGGPQLFNATTSVGADKIGEFLHAEGEPLLPIRPPQSLLLHVREGLPPGRRQQSRAVCRLRRGLPKFRHSRRAVDLQFRHGQQLRSGCEEQHRQPRQDCQQHLLHPLEQYPADRGAAGVPDLVHLEPRHGGGQGPGHPGGNRPDRLIHDGARDRLHRCPLHPGLALGADRRIPRSYRAATPSPAKAAQPGAPFTATIGLEYKFSLFNHESFIRVDDEYEGRAKWPSPGQDPTTSAVRLRRTMCCRRPTLPRRVPA